MPRYRAVVEVTLQVEADSVHQAVFMIHHRCWDLLPDVNGTSIDSLSIPATRKETVCKVIPRGGEGVLPPIPVRYGGGDI